MTHLLYVGSLSPAGRQLTFADRHVRVPLDITETVDMQNVGFTELCPVEYT